MDKHLINLRQIEAEEYRRTAEKAPDAQAQNPWPTTVGKPSATSSSETMNGKPVAVDLSQTMNGKPVNNEPWEA